VRNNTSVLRDADIKPKKTFERIVRDSSLYATTVGGTIRKAYPIADAGLGKTIDCYLDTDLTGEEVEVNCSIFGGSDLNEASPLLEKEADPIFISAIGDEWWCVSPFDVTEECECTTP